VSPVRDGNAGSSNLVVRVAIYRGNDSGNGTGPAKEQIMEMKVARKRDCEERSVVVRVSWSDDGVAGGPREEESKNVKRSR